MGTTLWINGTFVEPQSATISAFDASVQHGVGLFETMLATNGRVFRVEQHLERLHGSALELGLTEHLRTRALAEAVELVVQRSELATGEDRARIRLTVTGGDLNLLSREKKGPTDPTVMIHVQPATPYPDSMFEQGVGVVIASNKANPLNPFEGHKTLNYWWRLRELQAAAATGMGEAIVLQVTNHVAGGCVSNVFAVKDGALVTPIARGEEEAGAVSSPVLPGITKRVVRESAEAMGVGCAQRMMTITDVLDADELFLTNSSWGILPVVNVEKKAIGEGTPGPVTQELRDRWLRAISEEA